MPAARRGGRGARGREEGRGVGGDGEGSLGSGSLMVSAQMQVRIYRLGGCQRCLAPRKAV